MNRVDQKELRAGFQSEADATLRLIASLPAPEGLAERVQGKLRAGTARGGARVLAWPAAARDGFGWLRGVAAAAIVCVVTGGAWWISAKAPTAVGSAAAVHVRQAGGFSNAGAMHTPDTLNGPVLKKQGTGNSGQGTAKPASKGRPVSATETK